MTNLLQKGLVDERQYKGLTELKETLNPRHWVTELNRLGTLIRQKGSHMSFTIRGKALTAPLGHATELKRGTRNAMMEQLLSALEGAEDLSVL